MFGLITWRSIRVSGVTAAVVEADAEVRAVAGRLAVDEGVGVEALGGVVFEPRLPEDAGALGFGDAHAVGVQLDVVADAAAEGARRVFDDREGHRGCRR